jgi:hypothetical protein
MMTIFVKLNLIVITLLVLKKLYYKYWVLQMVQNLCDMEINEIDDQNKHVIA